MQEGLGLITNPTPLQIAVAVLGTFLLVFLMAAGGKAVELLGTGFKRLGRLLVTGAQSSKIAPATDIAAEAPPESQVKTA